MDLSPLVGSRVVVTCRNHLTYAGRLTGLRRHAGRTVAVLEVDEASGLCVVCPLDFVAEAVVSP